MHYMLANKVSARSEQVPARQMKELPISWVCAGGTFALYARIARVAKLPTPTATEQEFDTNLSRFGTKLTAGVKPSLSTYVSRACLFLPARC